MGLVQGKQCAIMEERASGGETSSEKGKERDLLSLMIKSNMDTDVPEGQRLSVDQVMHQIPTFIIAGMSFLVLKKKISFQFQILTRVSQGHETTSTSTTWALYALSLNPQCQMKLRAELRCFPHDSPSMDELNSFLYLDAVVRETMRLYPPLEVTTRVATQDDIIPLDEPFTDKDGQIRHEIQFVPPPSLGSLAATTTFPNRV
jgi:cytochrome P450